MIRNTFKTERQIQLENKLRLQLLEKIERYNLLHKKYYGPDRIGGEQELEQEMVSIETWILSQGLRVKRSTDLWDLFIKSKVTDSKEVELLDEIRAAKIIHLKEQNYEAVSELRAREKYLIEKWEKGVSEKEFYQSNDLFTYFDTFYIIKNIK